MNMESVPKSCADCGLAPTNHLSLWVSSTGDIFTQALPMHRLPFYRFFNAAGEFAASLLGRFFFALGRVLGIIRLTSDTETAVNRRSRLLWEEALRRGIPMEQLLFFGNPTDTFRIRAKRRMHFFKSLPLAPAGDALRMDDKHLFKEAMRAAHLPVPRSYSAFGLRSAKRALAELGSVCVKPRSGSNSRHTFPYVNTEEELREAFASTKQICAYASIEDHLEGNLCRATCVGGKIFGFLESLPPIVEGDGHSTVKALVAQANARRPEGVDEIVISSRHTGYIRRRGYELDSVLRKGVRLPLTFGGGTGIGGSNREHGRNIHPSFIEPIERAARLTGLHIVGFDLVIPDAQQPADSQRWGFVEANSLPWIDLHAGPFYGDPIDLAPAVWELWQRNLGEEHRAGDTR